MIDVLQSFTSTLSRMYFTLFVYSLRILTLRPNNEYVRDSWSHRDILQDFLQSQIHLIKWC